MPNDFYWVPGFTDAGSYTLTFTVTDNSGKTSQPVNVTLEVLDRDAAPAPPAFEGIEPPAGGRIMLTATGAPGIVCRVMGRTDLLHGAWSPLGVLTTGPDGMATWNDAGAGNVPGRFYRLQLP